MTISRRVRIYQIVVETILVIAMSFIIALFMWSILSAGPNHETIDDDITSLRQQVAILTCELRADTQLERAECSAISIDE